MLLETERLRIRDLRPKDATSIADIASDGSLMNVGFDSACAAWIDGWIEDARRMTRADDPRMDYLFPNALRCARTHCDHPSGQRSVMARDRKGRICIAGMSDVPRCQ